MAYKVGLASDDAVLFGESPLWDNRRGQLVLTDCFGKHVSIFDPVTRKITSKEVKPVDEEIIYTVISIPYASSTNKFLVTLSSGKLVEFDWDQNAITKVLYDCKNPLISYNDGKCDSKGRLWTGSGRIEDLGKLTMTKDKGEVYKLSKSSTTQGMLDSFTETGNFDLPNGLGFNKEQTKLFWNDLTGRVINLFDFDANNGKLGNRKLFFDFKDHSELDGSYPDGLCLDVSGNVWVACWKGACVIKIDGSNGKLLEKIGVPVHNTTSVAFGGTNYDRLYVTTTSIELDKSLVDEPDTGKIFEISCPGDSSFKGFQECFLDV
ncbi:regucalcin [Folsomia candida]|uniref:Regucalcin n=1 Tax=Folsomia candida TaxID=158441 RepID=A0A226EGS1_FOLCA|nr:regucalcin [Folsomia candida]OXA56284.1 Regucalcin [Folsomia candida]